MGTRAIRYARSIYEIVSAFLDCCILPPPYVHTYPIDFSLSPRKVYQPTCETDRDQRFSGFHKLRSLPRNRADNIIIANNVIVLPFLSSPSFYRFSIRISLYSRYEQFGHACIRRTKNRNILFFKFTRDSPSLVYIFLRLPRSAKKSYTPPPPACSNEYFLTLDFRERIRGPIPSNATSNVRKQGPDIGYVCITRQRSRKRFNVNAERREREREREKGNTGSIDGRK